MKTEVRTVGIETDDKIVKVPIENSDSKIVREPVVLIGGGSQPILESITITENGTYTPPYDVDGYNEIIVSVESGSIPLVPEEWNVFVSKSGFNFITSFGNNYFDGRNISTEDETYGYFETTKTYDLTNVNKIYALAENPKSNESIYNHFYLSKNSNSINPLNPIFDEDIIMNKYDGVQYVGFDTRELFGDYYIGFLIDKNNYLQIKNVTIEYDI